MPDMSTDHQAEPPPEVVAEQQAADARAAAAEAALRPELERLQAEVERKRADQDATGPAATVPSAAPAQPADPLDLDAIDAVLAHPLQNRPWRDIVRSLVAEVRRLRAERDMPTAPAGTGCSNCDGIGPGSCPRCSRPAGTPAAGAYDSHAVLDAIRDEVRRAG